MNQNKHCQSCGMPLKENKKFGTNADQSMNDKYCTYCYQDGKFTKPDITMKQMIDLCIGIMVKYGLPKVIATKKANSVIPTLERWNKN